MMILRIFIIVVREDSPKSLKNHTLSEDTDYL